PEAVLPARAAARLLGWARRAAAEDDPRGIIEKAVRAHGGAERIAQLTAVRMKVRGTLYLGKEGVPFSGETAAQLPDRLKNTLAFELEGKKQDVKQVVNGDKAAVTINGQPLP